MRLDPDAAARVASFGAMSPMRVRGLTAVRHAIESAPHPDDMPHHGEYRGLRDPRTRRPDSRPDLPPLDRVGGARAGLLPRRRHGHGLQPFVRAAGENACRPVERHRGVGGLPTRSRVPRTCPVRRRIRRPPNGLPRTPSSWALTSTRLAVVGDSAGGSLAAAVALAARDRGGPAICCPGAALPGPRPRYDGGVDGRTPRCADAQPRRHRLHARARRRRQRRAARPHTGCRPMRRTCQRTAARHRRDRRMRSDPDWGERYATRLRDAGVQTTVTRYPGAYHGFLMRSDATARGRLAIAEVCALLRAKFDNPVKFSSRSPDTLARPQTGAAHNRANRSQ